jgi:hypothetical protein
MIIFFFELDVLMLLKNFVKSKAIAGQDDTKTSRSRSGRITWDWETSSC